MPEAFGSILIKAPSEIVSDIKIDSDVVPWNAMSALFSFAGVDLLAGSNPMLEYKDREDFYVEGIEQKEGFIRIQIFGDEWMDAIQLLVKNGNNVEVYGSIFHEYGCREYYALNSVSDRFLEAIDYEGGEEFDEEAVIAAWLNVVPESVKLMFPDVFEGDSD